MVKVLVTGSPGVGKTTLLQHLVTQLGPDQCAGFTTQELRDQGGGRIELSTNFREISKYSEKSPTNY